jgi:hypothetical protein
LFKVEGKAVEGEYLCLTASFRNPLPAALHHSRFAFQAPGLDSEIQVKLAK